MQGGHVTQGDGFRARRLTRREVIVLLTAGAGFSLVAKADAGLLKASFPAAAPKRTRFPKDAVIRTLLKDISPEALGSGPILFHEHLSLNLAGLDEHFTDDVSLMIEEVKAAGSDGISCIVDAGHADMGRRMQALERIAAESGVPIVASGGYYLQRTFPPEVATRTVDEIADLLVREAREQRWGALGEIGQEGGELTADERKVFQAVAKVQVRTGLPIFTHNAYFGARSANTVPRDAAIRQLDVLESAGAKPEHVAIGHVCCLDDPNAGIPIQLARRGVFVGFDRVTIPIVTDEQKATTIMAMVGAGYADKILISSDFYSQRSLRKNGGAGVGQAVAVLKPLLLKAGMSERMLHGILVDNPRRFLAFVPKES
jgi:phosphotriesterase-related protein